MTELETAQKRIAELEARVQELGQMARDVNSRRAVELESELAAMRAVGEPVAEMVPCYTPSGKRVAVISRFQHLPIGTKLYTHPSPPEGMVMVPKMPTNAMTSAGANAVEDPENERSSWDLAENMWRAMIEAAPALKQGAAIAAGAPSIEDLCARIKAADDAAADCDYMLDSNDCIAVLRGEWKGPLAMDKPDRPSSGQAPAGAIDIKAAAQPVQPAAQDAEPDMFWDADDRDRFAYDIDEIVSEYDPGQIVSIECAQRLPSFRVLVTAGEDWNSYEYVDAAIAAQGEKT